jgi:hypothetical protein
MALIKKKTRKRLTKQIRKLVKKHGQDAVATLVTTALSAATAKVAKDGEDKLPLGSRLRKHRRVVGSVAL